MRQREKSKLKLWPSRPKFQPYLRVRQVLKSTRGASHPTGASLTTTSFTLLSTTTNHASHTYKTNTHATIGDSRAPSTRFTLCSLMQSLDFLQLSWDPRLNGSVWVLLVQLLHHTRCGDATQAIGSILSSPLFNRRILFSHQHEEICLDRPAYLSFLARPALPIPAQSRLSSLPWR